MLKSALILHHPESEGAVALAQRAAGELNARGVAVTVLDAWNAAGPAAAASAGLAIPIGGDGTVLRATSISVPHGVPLLCVNMGRLGFLSDIAPDDLFQNIDQVARQEWRLEDRIMVRGTISGAGGGGTPTYHGLNDIVVSRRAPGRPIYVDLRIDDARVATYRCDGMIVSTPTGSTGYSLSAGGPILAPTEHHLVVTPVSAHLALGRSLVLQPESLVELHVSADHGAALSVDGQEDLPLESGAVVTIGTSERVAHLVRFGEPAPFYSELAEKLKLQFNSAMNSSSRA